MFKSILDRLSPTVFRERRLAFGSGCARVVPRGILCVVVRIVVRVACAVLLCAGSVAGVASAHEVDSPVGRWQTYDDRTHAPRGIIRIFEKDGKMFGRIESDGDRSLCHACPDERKDQPLNGLVIIRNMQRGHADPLVWEGGDVLDPETGHIYRLKMQLKGSGSNLEVHGYIGVSLIGRSQTWARAPD